MLHFLDQFNAVIGVLLFSAYLYQVFYTLYGSVQLWLQSLPSGW